MKNLKDYSSAEAIYQKAFGIIRPLHEKKPGLYDIEMGSSLVNLAYLYKAQLESSGELEYKEKGLNVLGEIVAMLDTMDPTLRHVQRFTKHKEELQLYFNNFQK